MRQVLQKYRSLIKSVYSIGLEIVITFFDLVHNLGTCKKNGTGRIIILT